MAKTAAKSRLMHRLLLLIAGVGLVALSVTALRLRRTAEYRCLFGSAKERTDLCRAVPNLAPRRQAWPLKRLLRDGSEQVRLGAVTACARGAEDPGLDDLLEALLLDPAQPGDVRSKAGEVLLAHDAVRPAVASFLRANAGDRAFRAACPLLVARWAERLLSEATAQERVALLAQATDEDDPAHEFIQRVVQDHIEAFSSHRDRFVQELDAVIETLRTGEQEAVAPLEQFAAGAANENHARIARDAIKFIEQPAR